MMKMYGLIGYPLGHSFSKQYFTEKFNAEGILDCTFESFAISSIGMFPGIIKDNPTLKGIGVTIPYKEQVLAFIDDVSPEVGAIGATNSIRIAEGKLTAYNTDIIGFEESFKPQLQRHHKKALVLGTGGASKAVQYVLKKMGLEFLVVTRTPGEIADNISYADITKNILSEYRVIINCTPVGMYPNVKTTPNISYEYLTANHYLYDLVYKPKETLFLKRGAEKGALTKNGYDMLVIQAEASWKIWNDL